MGRKVYNNFYIKLWMVNAMGTTALVVPNPVRTREHRLEDLARRLSGELGVGLNQDQRYHGVSARTWLSGKSDRYELYYCDDLIYEDGPSNTGDETISIQRIEGYPRISISSYRGYLFTVDVSDDLIRSFIERHRVVSLEPVNPLHRRLILDIAEDVAKLEVKPKPKGIAAIFYSFRGHLFQSELDNLTGGIVRYYLD